MFGTLVVNLPSKFEGGNLIVRHNGQQHVFNKDRLGGETAGLSFVAFYADCEHEVKPVTKGYR
jgi:predicted 2-oxoglutarate/Fe(II)-dependent dioxygenase YbiX